MLAVRWRSIVLVFYTVSVVKFDTRGPHLEVSQVITPCQFGQARLQWNAQSLD